MIIKAKERVGRLSPSQIVEWIDTSFAELWSQVDRWRNIDSSVERLDALNDGVVAVEALLVLIEQLRDVQKERVERAGAEPGVS
jgi:hypothetical protein